jgi:hypothetical protein
VIAEGPIFLFDGMSFAYLARDLPTIDDIRPAEGLDYLTSGGDIPAAAALCRSGCGNTSRS